MPLSFQNNLPARLRRTKQRCSFLPKLLQAETANELAALLPAILDRAFKGES